MTDDLSRWGPLTDFQIDITEEMFDALPTGVAERIDLAGRMASSDLPTDWTFTREYLFELNAFRVKGRAPSALVAAMAAVAQGDDPTMLLDRLRIPPISKENP